MTYLSPPQGPKPEGQGNVLSRRYVNTKFPAARGRETRIQQHARARRSGLKSCSCIAFMAQLALSRPHYWTTVTAPAHGETCRLHRPQLLLDTGGRLDRGWFSSPTLSLEFHNLLWRESLQSSRVDSTDGLATSSGFSAPTVTITERPRPQRWYSEVEP